MQEMKRKRSPLGIAGIAVFLLSFVISHFIWEIPNLIYIILMIIAVVLVIAGAILENRAGRE